MPLNCPHHSCPPDLVQKCWCGHQHCLPGGHLVQAGDQGLGQQWGKVSVGVQLMALKTKLHLDDAAGQSLVPWPYPVEEVLP